MAVVSKNVVNIGTTVAGAGTMSAMIGELAKLPPAVLGLLIFFVWATTLAGSLARYAMIANKEGMTEHQVTLERRKAIGIFLAQFMVGCLMAVALAGDIVKLGFSCIVTGWLGSVVFERLAKMSGFTSDAPPNDPDR